jgi:mono/diheme cytochrome c family protein
MWNIETGVALLLAAVGRSRSRLEFWRERSKGPPKGGTPNQKRTTGYIGAALLMGLLLLCGSSCNQKMAIQPKEVPLRESEFYADGMSARPLPDNTVPRGHLDEDQAFYTGKAAGAASVQTSGAAVQTGGAQSASPTVQAANLASNVQPKTPGQSDIDYFPIAVTSELLARGRERFNIFCAPCHSRLGDGQGMVVKRGFRQPPSFHIDRLRNAPVGHFFDVITNGFGAMPDYAQQVKPRDRWAIIAYIRALQLSQHATLADVPRDKQSELDAGGQQK